MFTTIVSSLNLCPWCFRAGVWSWKSASHPANRCDSPSHHHNCHEIPFCFSQSVSMAFTLYFKPQILVVVVYLFYNGFLLMLLMLCLPAEQRVLFHTPGFDSALPHPLHCWSCSSCGFTAQPQLVDNVQRLIVTSSCSTEWFGYQEWVVACAG